MSDDVTLRHADAALVVRPAAGARAVSWTVAGHELLTGRSDHAVEHGMYPMAPWAGRLRDNRVPTEGGGVTLEPTYDEWAIHGTAWDTAFAVEDVTTDAVTLTAPLGAVWPWDGVVRVDWGLADGRMSCDVEVSSAADSFPVVLGLHPWFPRRLAGGAPLQVDLAASALLDRGPDHLPTGVRREVTDVSGPFDDAFVVPSGMAALTWPGLLRLDVVATVDHAPAHWYVLFDELPDLVCLEPQTGPPDGLGATDVHRVGPGRPVRLSTTWHWSLD